MKVGPHPGRTSIIIDILPGRTSALPIRGTSNINARNPSVDFDESRSSPEAVLGLSVMTAYILTIYFC
jgi:hypothetical protein